MSFIRATRVEQRNYRRAVIVEGALKIFDEHGYDEISFVKIANEVNINRSVIYTYFSNTAEILMYYLSKKLEEISDFLFKKNIKNENPFLIVANLFESDEQLLRVISIYGSVLEPAVEYRIIYNFRKQLKRLKDVIEILYNEYCTVANKDEGKFSFKFQVFSTLLIGVASMNTDNDEVKRVCSSLGFKHRNIKLVEIIENVCC